MKNFIKNFMVWGLIAANSFVFSATKRPAETTLQEAPDAKKLLIVHSTIDAAEIFVSLLDREQKIIGYIEIDFNASFSNSHLKKLKITPSYTGKGLGGPFLRAAIGLVINLGAKKIDWQAFPLLRGITLPKLIEFYQKALNNCCTVADGGFMSLDVTTYLESTRTSMTAIDTGAFPGILTTIKSHDKHQYDVAVSLYRVSVTLQKDNIRYKQIGGIIMTPFITPATTKEFTPSALAQIKQHEDPSIEIVGKGWSIFHDRYNTFDDMLDNLRF